MISQMKLDRAETFKVQVRQVM